MKTHYDSEYKLDTYHLWFKIDCSNTVISSNGVKPNRELKVNYRGNYFFIKKSFAWFILNARYVEPPLSGWFFISKRRWCSLILSSLDAFLRFRMRIASLWVIFSSNPPGNTPLTPEVLSSMPLTFFTALTKCLIIIAWLLITNRNKILYACERHLARNPVNDLCKAVA